MSSLQFSTEKHCHLAVKIAASGLCLLCGGNSDGSSSKVCFISSKIADLITIMQWSEVSFMKMTLLTYHKEPCALNCFFPNWAEVATFTFLYFHMVKSQQDGDG